MNHTLDVNITQHNSNQMKVPTQPSTSSQPSVNTHIIGEATYASYIIKAIYFETLIQFNYAHDDSFVDDLEEEDEDAVDVAAAGAGGGSRRRAHTGRHAGRHARSRYSGDEGSVNEDDASYTTPSRRPQKRDAPRHPGLVSVTRLAGFQDVSYEEDQSYNSSDAASAYESMSTSISSSSTSVDFSNLARAVLDDSLLTETTYSSSGHSSNSSNSRDRNIPHAAGDNELDAADDREDEDDLSVDICTPFERAQTDNANNNRTGLRLWRPAAGNLVGKWK
jgi:hypothetical protein